MDILKVSGFFGGCAWIYFDAASAWYPARGICI